MKIIGQTYYGDINKNPSLLKRQMEAILGAWRMARAPYLTQRVTPPEGTDLTAEDWQIWLRILRVAEPVPPRDHIDGLRQYARLGGFSVEELERDKIILIIDDQVAFRMRPPALQLKGYSWSFLVSPERVGHTADGVRAVLQKRFRDVTEHEASILASGSWENCTDSVFVLINDALAAATPEAVRRAWRLALALSLQWRFLAALPASPAKDLSDLLGNELREAAGRLDVVTDAKLSLFGSGQEATLAPSLVRPLPMPESRLSDVLEAQAFLNHADHSIADGYYETVADAFARIAEIHALGEMLRLLPAGRALLAAIDAIWRNRPEDIATYVWHPAFQAEGAFALLRHRLQHEALPNAFRLSLSEEWLEVQRLGRELLLLADRTNDWASLVALGIRDEAEAVGRRHQGVAFYEQDNLHYDGAELWSLTIRDPARSEQYVAVLERYFRARAARSDPAFVFALRILADLRESGQRDLAVRLAMAIVDGYAAGLALDIEVKAIPGVLCAYGALLAGLWELLAESGDSRRKLLRPFGHNTYLDAARGDVSNVVSSWTVNPIHDVPHIFRAHAETLTALASAIRQPDEVLDTVLELYEADRTSALTIKAFSWSALARVTGLGGRPACEPLFIRIGRLFGRDRGDRRRLDAFLKSEPEAHILAYVASGLGGSHPFAEAIRPPLRSRINDLLADPHGIALGHCLELSSALQQAGMPRDSERLARRALEIIDEHPRIRGPFEIAARAQLAGALAQQELWPEVLAFEPQGNTMVVSPPAQFIENMRALALLDAKRFTDAEGVMRGVLAANSANNVALVNLTALYLSAGDLQKTVEACDQAKAVLAVGDDRDRVLANEAIARKRMGDTFGAAKLLDGLTGEARARADIAEARDRTAETISPDVTPGAVGGAGAGPDAQVIAQPVRVAAPPDSGVDIAIITVLKQEYEAVRDILDKNWKIVPADHQYPSPLYGWITGTIPKADGTGAYRVVLACAWASGNLRTFSTTQQTIDRWRPRYVLLSGIAGGLPRERLAQGDLVIANQIWYYEYMKLAAGQFRPRYRDTYNVDEVLLNSAQTYESAHSAWKLCKEKPPRTNHVPKMVVGLFVSGEKVIDDLDLPYVRSITKARPESQAIEMEGAGACAAVERAQGEGRVVGFLMLRGISDMPAGASGWLTTSLGKLLPAGLLPRRKNAASSGTDERDSWKLYASAIAAQFIASWVGSAWPQPPR